MDPSNSFVRWCHAYQTISAPTGGASGPARFKSRSSKPKAVLKAWQPSCMKLSASCWFREAARMQIWMQPCTASRDTIVKYTIKSTVDFTVLGAYLPRLQLISARCMPDTASYVCRLKFSSTKSRGLTQNGVPETVN